MDIRWVPAKPIDVLRVSGFLQTSADRNHFANGGPCVKRLEKELVTILDILPTKRVIATTNGAAALHALIAGLSIAKGRNISLATQAFTFPASAQGPLRGSTIVDIDEQGGPDLNQVPKDIDGLVVTNVFGHVTPLDKYVQWAQGKYLILDNAACPLSYYRGVNSLNYGTGSIVSFHHTKPLGFGEGGAVIVDAEYEPYVRRAICFGYGTEQVWNEWSSNWKMSDPAAAYILSHLYSTKEIQQKHIRGYEYIEERLPADVRLLPHAGESLFASCIPVLFPTPISLPQTKIEIKKYYRPLVSRPVSDDWYNRILCFPLTTDMNQPEYDLILETICACLSLAQAATPKW